MVTDIALREKQLRGILVLKVLVKQDILSLRIFRVIGNQFRLQIEIHFFAFHNTLIWYGTMLS